MLYTGPGAAALTGRCGRSLTVIIQARFARRADRTEWPLHGNESGTAGTASLNFAPVSQRSFAFGGRFLFVSLKVRTERFEGGIFSYDGRNKVQCRVLSAAG